MLHYQTTQKKWDMKTRVKSNRVKQTNKQTTKNTTVSDGDQVRSRVQLFHRNTENMSTSGTIQQNSYWLPIEDLRPLKRQAETPHN